MNKNNKIMTIIGIILIVLLCICCIFLGKNASESTSLYVEDGIIKYKNDDDYEEIISLEDLLTKDEVSSIVDGKEIKFSISDGYIIWNYVNDSKTNKLIAVESLVGEQGNNGKDGADGKDGVNGKDGTDGKSAYIWVKYLDNDPNISKNEDLKDEASSYMGIYYGESSSAPNDISSYKWHAVKGEKGDK